MVSSNPGALLSIARNTQLSRMSVITTLSNHGFRISDMHSRRAGCSFRNTHSDFSGSSCVGRGVKGARASRSVDRVPSFTRCGGRSMIVFRRGAAFGARGGRVGSRRGRTIGPRPVKIVDTRVPHADSQCARGVAATSGERRAMRTSNFTFLSTAGGFMCFKDAPAAAGPPCRLLGAGMLPPGPAPRQQRGLCRGNFIEFPAQRPESPSER